MLVAVIGLLCVLIIRPLVSLNQALQCEYGTQQVIQMVDEYVRVHGGKWPTFWADLGQEDNSRYAKHTCINFDLTSEDLLKDHRLIHSAIAPATGEYIFYPHADRNLDTLLETIAKTAATQPSPVRTSAPASSRGDALPTPEQRS